MLLRSLFRSKRWGQRPTTAERAQPRQATLDFINHNRNKYEILLDAKTRGNYHPTFWNGIIVFRKC